MAPTLSATTIGVLGSGEAAHEPLAGDVGRLLAELEVNLLTGGGHGVMTAVSRAYVAARRGRGICIGIIPSSETDRARPKSGYPNAFVELAIYTHLPYSGERGQDALSRNHINVLSCAALIALPGSAGTASEIGLAVRYAKPIVVYGEPAAGAQVPPTIPRARRIDEVRSFLTPFIGKL